MKGCVSIQLIRFEIPHLPKVVLLKSGKGLSRSSEFILGLP